MSAQTKYRPEMCEEIIQKACEGRSMVQIAADWRIDEDTMKGWRKDNKHPEFTLAYKIARTCNEAYWEDIGQKGAKGVYPKFNAIAWGRIMSARHQSNWTETSKQKVEMKNEFKAMTDDEIDEALKLLLAQKKSNQGSGAPVQAE